MGFNWGQTAQGAMGGATLGSTIPGVGTLGGALIGGGLGALGGLFGGGGGPSEQEKLLMAMAQEQSKRQAPMLGNAAQAGYSDFRDNQSGLVSQLEALSRGQGPSLATEMLKQNTANASANQMAQAAGARGNATMANRQALNNSAMMTGQAAGQAAQMRAQEQLGAMQQLGLTLHGARGMDESMNQWNAGQQNAFSMQNANNQLQFWAQNDMARLAALQGGYGMQQQTAQQPGIGDYLMAFGGGLGQQRALAQQGQRQGQPQQQGFAPDNSTPWYQQFGTGGTPR
jgi:hypothetical protein